MDFIEENKEEASSPEWGEFDSKWKHVHDWRTYITDELRQNWDSLSLETRCALVNCCQQCADAEIWN